MPADVSESSTADGARLGILFMTASMLLFTASDALGKWIVTVYPVAQFLALRSAVALIALFAFTHVRWGGLAEMFRRQPRLHLLRIGFVISEVACFFLSVKFLPLADVFAFYLASPLFLTVFSALILRERVGPRRWVAIALGLCGVFVIFPPSGAAVSLPAIFALGGSVSLAMMLILTRKLRGSDDIGLLTIQTLGVGIACGVLAPFDWVTPRPLDFGLIALLGIVATSGHFLMNRAVSLAPAAIVAPFQFTSIVWASLLGYLIWNDVPTTRTILGSALIIAAGLSVIWFERRAKARAV
jgi:drug/metabolite transporter (DMT)-like permease